MQRCVACYRFDGERSVALFGALPKPPAAAPAKSSAGRPKSLSDDEVQDADAPSKHNASASHDAADDGDNGDGDGAAAEDGDDDDDDDDGDGVEGESSDDDDNEVWLLGRWCDVRARLFQIMVHFTNYAYLKVAVSARS